MNELSPTGMQIMQRLKSKSVTKFQVYDNTFKVFSDLKHIAEEFVLELKQIFRQENLNIPLDFKERGQFEFEIKVASDLLVVTMHSNIFEFPREHAVMKTSYVKEDSMRSYCGSIRFYNFLADSFKYSRYSDVGYLVARVFINKEFHYMVEGKRQIGFLYNDFVNKMISKEDLRVILETAILYCMDFDLLTPPYETIKEVSVGEMFSLQSSISLKTGKRLGFQFQADKDEILGMYRE